MPPHPLTNLEILRYYQNEPRFNGVYSRNKLPRTRGASEAANARDGAYIINLDDYAKTGTHWVACYIIDNSATYFDSFGIEHLPQEIEEFVNHLGSINKNIYRIQAYDSVMCGYFCIGFVDYMLNGKTLTDFTSLFSPNDFESNDRKIKELFGV